MVRWHSYFWMVQWANTWFHIDVDWVYPVLKFSQFIWMFMSILSFWIVILSGDSIMICILIRPQVVDKLLLLLPGKTILLQSACAWRTLHSSAHIRCSLPRPPLHPWPRPPCPGENEHSDRALTHPPHGCWCVRHPHWQHLQNLYVEPLGGIKKPHRSSALLAFVRREFSKCSKRIHVKTSSLLVSCWCSWWKGHSYLWWHIIYIIFSNEW